MSIALEGELAVWQIALLRLISEHVYTNKTSSPQATESAM